MIEDRVVDTVYLYGSDGQCWLFSVYFLISVNICSDFIGIL